MKIYLIRHGQSTSDVEDRYGGDYDDHLTEKGEQQAKELAKSLKGKGIQAVFCSPRFRAKETAEIVSKDLNAPLEVVEDFRECNRYGIITGMVKAEAKEQYPDEVAKLGDYRNTVQGGENYDHFKLRVIAAFEQIKTLDYNTVAIITHAGPIRCLAREVLDMGELGNIADCQIFEL